MISGDPVLRVFRKKRRKFLFGDRRRPIANGRIDNLPFPAKFAIPRIVIPAFASQFVDFERLSETLGTDAVDTTKQKSGGHALSQS
jgi:hypothetical protein